MFKKVMAVMLATCLFAGTLSACGKEQQNTDDKVSTSESQKETETAAVEESETEEIDYSDVTFRVSWWGSDERHESTVKMIDEFAKQFPGLEVEVEYCGYGDYFTKLTTQAAGNDLPDVFQSGYEWVSEYASSGMLLELDPLFEDGSIDTTYVDPSALDIGVVDGNKYAIATGTNAPCIIYNPAVLEEAGVTISKTPTMSEYIEVCKAVEEATGAKGYIPSYEIFIRSLGADIYAGNEPKLGFDGEMISTFWKYKLRGLTENYYIGPDDYREADDASNFAKKVIWCQGGFTNHLASLESKSGLELEMFCYPVADDASVNNATYLQPNMLWSASKASEHPELVAAFLDFFVNNTVTYDICGTDRGVPISSKMREHISGSLDSSGIKVNEFMDFLADGNSSSKNFYSPSKGTEAFEIFEGFSEEISYEAVTEAEIETRAEEIIQEMNDILSSSK